MARCRVPLPDDSRDVLADAIFTRLEDLPKRSLFSITTALIILGNRSEVGRLEVGRLEGWEVGRLGGLRLGDWKSEII